MKRFSICGLSLIVTLMVCAPVTLAEPVITDILDILYTNTTNGDGWTEIFYDEIWYNPNGSAQAQVKYAGWDQYFGVINGSNNVPAYTSTPYDSNVDGDVIPLFEVTGDGYSPTVTTLCPTGWVSGGWYSFDHTVTGSLMRFYDDPNGKDTGAPLWSSKNSDNLPGNLNHMRTFAIWDSDGYTGSYAIAFEDQNPGDGDFNDLVVEVRGVNPVPEPSVLILLGVGISALGVIHRRRRRS